MVVALILGIAASAYIVSSIQTNLQNQISLLQTKSEQLQQKNVDLENQVTQLQGKSAQLEANYTNLQNQTDALQEKSAQLEANLTALYNQLNPSFMVTFWKTQPAPDIGLGTGIYYVFNVSGTRESFQFASSDAIDQVLAPLFGKYPFVTMTTPGGVTVPFWTSGYVGNGQFQFNLSLKTELNIGQLQSLIQDVSNALKNA